ncbi:MAG: hypothetical protein ACT4QG_22905, partial [Sporichthyaceae bacterium]
MTEQARGERRGGGNTKGRKASFGSIRERGPKRYQARYTGPDGRQYTAYTPGGSASFQTRTDADRALARLRVEIDEGAWVSPIAVSVEEPEAAAPLSFGAYADSWLEQRPLAARTRDLYRSLLDRHI